MYKNLVNAIITKETDKEDVKFYIDFIEEKLETFVKYFNAVYKDVMASNINRQLFAAGYIDGETLRARTIETDCSRKIIHDVAIASCAQLNRLCETYGVTPFCPSEDADRTEIADFIGTFVYNVFQEGIGKTDMDKAVEIAKENSCDADRAYNPSAMKKEVEFCLTQN